MKKIFTKFALLMLLVCTPVLINQVFADAPPDPGGGPGGGDGPVGGGSPVGGGLFLLISLGTAYGFRKFLDSRKKLME